MESATAKWYFLANVTRLPMGIVCLFATLNFMWKTCFLFTPSHVIWFLSNVHYVLLTKHMSARSSFGQIFFFQLDEPISFSYVKEKYLYDYVKHTSAFCLSLREKETKKEWEREIGCGIEKHEQIIIWGKTMSNIKKYGRNCRRGLKIRSVYSWCISAVVEIRNQKSTKTNNPPLLWHNTHSWLILSPIILDRIPDCIAILSKSILNREEKGENERSKSPLQNRHF